MLLGIDLGAGSLKATLISPKDGRVQGEGSHPISTQIPHHGWSEQDPEAWFEALCQAVPAALRAAGVQANAVTGVGISAGAHIPVLLDEQGKVLRPAIMWNDQRSSAQAARLREQHGVFIEATSLNRANPTWALAMLAWLQEYEPQVVARTRRFCLPKDYLRWRLTGEWATDFSDVIGALMADVNTRDWSQEICALIDWPLDTLPPVREPTAIAGQLTPQAATCCGLAVGTPVVVGSNDTTVEFFGVGCLEPGQTAIKLATAGVLFLAVDRPLVVPPISCYPHILPERYYLATGTNACASAHRWVRDRCFPELSFEAMDALASEAPAGSGGILFHPYLQGERGPHWDPHLRGNFLGLSMAQERSHLARAVYEGIAYSIADLLDDARAKSLEFGPARLLGGGGRSATWRQILADVTGLSMEIPETADASFGAALLAGVGVGVFRDPREAVSRCVRVLARTDPDPARHSFYGELLHVYQQATTRLKALDRRLQQIIHGGEL